MAGIRDQESGGDYRAQSSTETASGAYQYINSTWSNYGGYAHAKDAPPAVQDQRMREDLLADYRRFDGDWERVIAAHFVGDNGADTSKSSWNEVPGDPASHNPSIRSYVDSVLAHIHDGTGAAGDASHGITTANTDQLLGSPGAAKGAGQDTATVVAAQTIPAAVGQSPTPVAAATPTAPVAGHAATYALDAGAPITSPGLDSDHDGLTDAFERSVGTNPFDADTDHDGLSDSLEVSLGTNPTDADSDHDGRTDGAEVHYGGDPRIADGPTNFAPIDATVPAVTGPAATVPAASAPAANLPATAGSASNDGNHTVAHMMDRAMAQRGDTYIFGADVNVGDPDPKAFDCSKLTEWAAHQAGVEIPGTSYEQYLDLKAKGLLIPVDKAAHIKGALIFHFSSEPVPGGGRPSEAHVAFSMGDGTHDLEAYGDNEGVNVFAMDNRFNYAALLPGLDYNGADPNTTATAATSAADATAASPTLGDHSAAGLTVDDVMAGVRDQESGGDYHAQSSTETASGAYQYIDSTWNDYGGYAHAKDAPKAVQDQRMREDLLADSKHFNGDWERVIAAHFVGQHGAEKAKSTWDDVPGDPASHNPSVRSYVDSVLTHIKDDTGASLTGGSSSPGQITTANTDQLAGSAHAGAADPVPATTGAGTSGYALQAGPPVSAGGVDSDHDGLTDAFEKSIGTDPNNPDSDHDGLTDGYEVIHSHTNPLAADSDHDGLTDSFEVSFGTDPNDPDSDHDGFTDSYEVKYGTNPLGSGPAGPDVGATDPADAGHHAPVGPDLSWH